MAHSSTSNSTLPPSGNHSPLWDVDRNIDVSAIKGNMSDEMKRLAITGWDFFVSTEDKSFGASIGKRLKFEELNIWGEKGESYAETIGFITIDKGIVQYSPYTLEDTLC